MSSDALVIKKRIEMLRERMGSEKRPADLCLITGDDYHGSEYVGDFFKVREFFSGFTGSAGTLLVSMEEAWLFTDGRYFVQAERELEGTGIILMRSGTQGVLSVLDFIRKKAAQISAEKEEEAVLVCDGRTISAGFGEKLASDENVVFDGVFDPAECIWTDRPKAAATLIFVLDEDKYAGERVDSKLSRIRKSMHEAGCDCHLLASLDDIAWTLNLRASDIECTPVFTAFLWIEEEKAVLFTDTSRITGEVERFLLDYGTEVRNYDEFYGFLKNVLNGTGEIKDAEAYSDADSLKTGAGQRCLLYDKSNVNCRIYEIIKNAPGIPGHTGDNPAKLFKAVKNPVEIKNLSQVHIDDGLCVFRLMRYVKEAVKNNEPVTELSVADYIDGLRRKIPDFKELSFPTISAFGANAAMMHYQASDENNAGIEPGSMLLVDSGGQYFRGTTDVTRTFALGEVGEGMKKAYTLTLKGAMALSDAVFLEGCSGYSLDILARQPLWKEHIDYRCGTGHGVGYMLGVHEGPNAFRWKYIPGVSEIANLEPGMVTTDEPGVYVEGEYGIRFENELLCEEDDVNEYGRFLKFRILTVAPVDPDLIDKRWLDETDIDRINRYSAFVYETLAPKVKEEELPALKEYTRRIV